MLQRLIAFWNSFEWCLNYWKDSNGKNLNIELEILDTKTNYLCTMNWTQLILVDNEEITVLNK